MPTTYPATDKQKLFIATLLAERDVPAVVADAAPGIVSADDFSKKMASEFIDKLMALPKKVVARRPAGAAPAANRYDGVVHSKYAIETSELPASVQHLAHGNDMLFLEVRQYNGHVYMRKLTGAPGSFARTPCGRREEDLIIPMLKGHGARYAVAFGEHYSCCGKCGAELTVDRSRELKLGPVCAPAFGIEY